MAKEKFVREKPHVNIGMIGCGVLLAAGVVAVMVIPNLQQDNPPQPAEPDTGMTIPLPSATATLASPVVDLPGSELSLVDIQANWVLYQNTCGGELAALKVNHSLLNYGVEVGGFPSKTLLLLVFGPPGQDSTGDLPMYVEMFVIPHVITGDPVSIAPGEKLQLVVEFMENHPDFAWIPQTISDPPDPTQAAQSGDVLLERWQTNGIGHTLPSEGEMEDVTIVVMLLPEVPGLFKDTAEGDTGEPFSFEVMNGEAAMDNPNNGPGFFWSFDADKFGTEDDGIGAVYEFSIEGDNGPNAGLLVSLPSSEDGPPEIPPKVIILWGQGFPAYNESDLAFLHHLSGDVGWAVVSGLSSDIDKIEYTHPDPCPPTSTPTNTSAGGQSAPNATLVPSRTPRPTPKPTETRPEPEKTKESDR